MLTPTHLITVHRCRRTALPFACALVAILMLAGCGDAGGRVTRTPVPTWTPTVGAPPDPALAQHKRQIELRGAEIPSLLALPAGCTFHPRCPYFVPGQCDVAAPPLEPLVEGGRVACPVRKLEHISLLV